MKLERTLPSSIDDIIDIYIEKIESGTFDISDISREFALLILAGVQNDVAIREENEKIAFQESLQNTKKFIEDKIAFLQQSQTESSNKE